MVVPVSDVQEVNVNNDVPVSDVQEVNVNNDGPCFRCTRGECEQ